MYQNQYLSSYEQFIAHAKVSSIPGIKSVVDDVVAGRRRLVEKDIYSLVDASSKSTIDFFETDKLKGVGSRNIAQAQLPDGVIMLVDRITLLAVTSAADPFAFEDLYDEDFGSIKDIAGLQHGEARFVVNKKTVLDEFSLRNFVTDNTQNLPLGMFPLNAAHLINHSVELEFELKLPIALPAKTGLKLILHGIGTAPN